MEVIVDGMIIDARSVGPPFIPNMYAPMILKPVTNVTLVRREHI